MMVPGRSRYRGLLAVFLPVLPACGGTEGERLTPAPAEALPDDGPRFSLDCYRFEHLELLPIEDFESGAATNAYTNNELCERCGITPEPECLEVCEASQLPSPYENPIYAERLASSQCGQERGLHVRAGPFFAWGGTLGFPLPRPLMLESGTGLRF